MNYFQRRFSRQLFLEFLIILILNLGLCSGMASAKIQYVTVEKMGTGKTTQAAIHDALGQALGQVNGMEMSTQEKAGLSSVKLGGSINKLKAIAELNKESFQQDVRTATKGVIKRYEILTLKKNPHDHRLLNVTLKATIAKFQNSNQTKRRRISVLPFHMSDPGNRLQRIFANTLCQGLVSYLTQTRKFAVLDRNFKKETMEELNFLRDKSVPVEEMAKLGNRLGTDFIVVGQINKAVAQKWYKKMKSTGRKFTMSRYGGTFSYRVLDVATGQILFSQFHDGIRTRGGELPDLNRIAQKNAKLIGEQIVQSIFPLAVVSVSGQSVYLGQGGETITMGQKYKLVQYKKPLMDPYTKEFLGREEIEVGVVQITDVQAKTSRAKILRSQIDINAVFAPNAFIVRPFKNQGKPKRVNRVKEIEKKAKEAMDRLKKESEDDW